MVRTLSPLARLDEMHPTLAKFSIPSGRQIAGDSHVGMTSFDGGGLSLAAAFESIEDRKAELQVRGSAADVTT